MQFSTIEDLILSFAFSPCECSTITQFLVPFEDIFSHESSRRRREAARGRAAKPQKYWGSQ